MKLSSKMNLANFKVFVEFDSEDYDMEVDNNKGWLSGRVCVYERDGFHLVDVFSELGKEILKDDAKKEMESLMQKLKAFVGKLDADYWQMADSI